MNSTQQKEMLAFIRKFIKKNGQSPTISEIMQGIGSKSRSLVQRHLRLLEEQRFIFLCANKKRNIQLRPQKSSKKTTNIELARPCLLPYVGKIAAGQPVEAIEDKEFIDVSKWLSGDDLYILHITGDSMLGDHICNGDYAICKRSERINKDDIAVVLVDNSEVTLKRVWVNEDKTVTLLPSNPHYSPMVYDAERVEVQGKFLHLLRVGRR